MLTLPPGLLGRDIELGAVEVTPEQIRAYAESTGDVALAAGPCAVAPLGYALTLRGPVPEVALEADTVSVHAGHTITAPRPLTAPGTYTVRARLAEVFEKSGRSGPLTVIVRQTAIHGDDGSLTVTVEDRQIVRWHRGSPLPQGEGQGEGIGKPAATAQQEARLRERKPSLSADDDGSDASDSGDAAGHAGELEVGAVLGPERRPAPGPEAIALYADSLGGRESLFVDPGFARSLGYPDVIVPGPLQSALMEAMLRRRLAGWTLRHLSMTFRISVIANEPIAMATVVIERLRQGDRGTLICDLSLENRDGERAALGTAELTRPV